MKKTLFALLIGAGLVASGPAEAHRSHKHHHHRKPVPAVAVGWVWVPGVWVGVRYQPGYWSHPQYGHVRQHARPYRQPVRVWVPGRYVGYGPHRRWVPGHYRYTGRR